MPERDSFSEVAAEHILDASASPITSERFGEGTRFTTASGRNLDVFDGRAVGVNGKGASLVFDASDLAPVYAADSVGFDGTLNGQPFAFTFRADTGDVIFPHGVPGGAIAEDSVGADNGTVAEQAQPSERGELVSVTGNIGRKPTVTQVKGKPRVRLLVAEHRQSMKTPEPGATWSAESEEQTIWHEVWTTDKIGPKVAGMVEEGVLTQGTEVQVKGYQHRHPPKDRQTEGKPFIRAFVVNPVRRRVQG